MKKNENKNGTVLVRLWKNIGSPKNRKKSISNI